MIEFKQLICPNFDEMSRFTFMQHTSTIHNNHTIHTGVGLFLLSKVFPHKGKTLEAHVRCYI